MAQSPTWRRRLAAFGVLGLAAGALIATSPPPIPKSTLESTFRAAPELTGANPRITGVVTLDLSAAALPPPSNRSLRLSGTVSITARNDLGVRTSVRPLGVVAQPSESEAVGSEVLATWPIEQLCRVAEPCRREFEVTMELLGGTLPGAGQSASFMASVEIVYHEIDAIPPGATATWSASPEIAPAPAGS